MSREMISFVVRFVREVSEEQGARWRGLIQHVQSGAEQSFAEFGDAVQFMQGHVVEQTAEALEGVERMAEQNPLADLGNEMTRLWGEWGPRVAEMWGQAAQEMLERSAAFRDQVDQAVANTLKTWKMPTGVDQPALLERLDRLSQQIAELAARVEALENGQQKKGGMPND